MLHSAIAYLQFVDLPSTIVTIEPHAFFNCVRLESITINKAQYLGSHAFYGCYNLKSITLSSSIPEIFEWTFSACTNLLNIELPSTLTRINDYAFKKCTKLESVVINGNSLKFIGVESFSETIVKKFDLSKCVNFDNLGLKSIQDTASLSILILPLNLKKISDMAVRNSGVTNITFPQTLTSIGIDSFADCLYLEEINIPENSALTSIGIGAFRGCMRLKKISSFSNSYRVMTGALFTYNLDSLVLFPPASEVTSFSLPGDTRFINEGAFLSCTNLVSIFIPSDSISYISTSAFESCSSLSLIHI